MKNAKRLLHQSSLDSEQSGLRNFLQVSLFLIIFLVSNQLMNWKLIILCIRKFPVVEKRWRGACEKEDGDDFKYHMLPNDSELSAAFGDRKKRLVLTCLF